MKVLLPVVCDVVSPMEELGRSYTGIIVCVVVLVIAIALLVMRAAIKKRKNEGAAEEEYKMAVAQKESDDKAE